MRKLLIGVLGGVDHAEYVEHAYAHENYKLLFNQVSSKAERLEQKLNDTEGNYIQAALQAEQLVERLRVAELTIERIEEERANASAGWNNDIARYEKELAESGNQISKLRGDLREIREQRDEQTEQRELTTQQCVHLRDDNDNLATKLAEAERRIAELNTLIVKESDKPKATRKPKLVKA